MRGCKLPRSMGGSIGPRREICETSGLPTAVVPDVHRSNGYIKRKLREWRGQECNALVAAEIALTCAGSQTTPFNGRTGPRRKICESSGLPTALVPRLHQINGYTKRKLREWRAQNCNALVGAETELTSVGSQTTPFHGGEYKSEKGNMRNFGPTNSRCTACIPK